MIANRFPVFLKLLLGLQMLAAQQSFADGYKLVKHENAIFLYERWIPHQQEQVRELKAEFTVKINNPERVMNLLKNESKGLEWNPNAQTYKVLPVTPPYTWMAYIRYDVPWPMDDYDCLLLYRYEILPGKVQISFNSTNNNRFPLSEDITRITGTQGKWILQTTGNSLKIVYIVTTDRNKSIPRWVSDPIIHDNLFKTMSRFRNLLEQAAG